MKKTENGIFREMTINKKRLCIVSLSLLMVFFMILASGADSRAASFSADMVQSKKSGVATTRFFMRDHQYRMEAKEEGMTLHILVDRKSGKTRIVVPDEKVYLEMKNDDMRSLMNNPFEAYGKLAGMTEVRASGSETVNGIKCEKKTLSENGKDFMTGWIAQGFGFPLRIENLDNAEKVELKNIKEESLKDGLFEVPAGYRLVDAMPVPPPEWAADIDRAPVMNPPFEKTLEDGQMVRIRPREGYAIVVNGRSPDGEKGAFTSVAFKDGRPLTDPSMGTFNVSGSSSMGTRHKQGPGEADHVVVRVGKGRIAIKTGFDALPPEGVRLNEFSLKSGYGKTFDLDHRKASRVYVTDNADDGNATRGAVTIYTVDCKEVEGGTYCQPREIGKEDLVLDNGKTRMWEFEEKRHISHMDIEILSGGVDVRVEQPQVAGEIPPSWKQKNVKESEPTPPERKTGQETKAAPEVKAPVKANAGKPVALPQTKEEAKTLKGQDGKQGDAGFMNGEVPLFDGAKVIKDKSQGANASAELQVVATPQEVIDFYSEKMPEKGWTPGMVMVRGTQGVAMFMQSNRQLVIKVVGQGDTSKISMGIVGQ